MLAAAACAAALALPGCGSDEEGAPIPADEAAILQDQLDDVQARIDNGSVGACRDVTASDSPNTLPVQQAIDSLPERVDADVRQALEDGFARLFELVEERCDELEAEQQEEAPPPEPVEPETTPEELPEEAAPEEDEEGEGEGEGNGDERPPGQGPDGEGPPGQEPDPDELLPGEGESGGGAIVPEEDG